MNTCILNLHANESLLQKKVMEYLLTCCFWKRSGKSTSRWTLISAATHTGGRGGERRKRMARV